MALRIVLRSYGGDNDKGRPPFYSKNLVVASFVRAARVAQSELAGRGEPVEVPIPSPRLALMQTAGQVLPIPGGPVGMRDSYRYGLDMPDRLGWADDDLVVFVEDDYLLTADAFTVLAEGARALPEASYFAISGSRPTDYDDPAQQQLHGMPVGWRPLAPDRVVGERTWINVLSVASTFAARVGALRADRDVFELCMKPFRNRYLDHETCLLYQGITPYRARVLLRASRRLRARAARGGAGDGAAALPVRAEPPGQAPAPAPPALRGAAQRGGAPRGGFHEHRARLVGRG